GGRPPRPACRRGHSRRARADRGRHDHRGHPRARTDRVRGSDDDPRDGLAAAPRRPRGLTRVRSPHFFLGGIGWTGRAGTGRVLAGIGVASILASLRSRNSAPIGSTRPAGTTSDSDLPVARTLSLPARTSLLIATVKLPSPV